MLLVCLFCSEKYLYGLGYSGHSRTASLVPPHIFAITFAGAETLLGAAALREAQITTDFR
jgi:hypothetical protein